MLRPTFAQVKSSSLPAAIGLCAKTNSAGVAMVTNEIQERLLHDPMAPEEGWWGGWLRMLFNVTVGAGAGYIVTPFDIARLILMDVCARPIPLRNGFYEYLEFSRGLEPKTNLTWLSQPMEAFERDNVVTFATFPTSPRLIRIYMTDNGDTGTRVVVQGPDQNSMAISNVDFTTHITALGEVLYLQAPFVTSTNQFSSVTGILKTITRGQVQIFTVDPATGAETLLSTMEPRETTASYRRYLVNGLPANCCNTPGGVVQVSAQCKLDFVPVIADSDFLLITSIPALIEEAQAYKYSRMDTRAAAGLEQKHHAKALGLLRGQLDHFLGRTTPAIRIPIFGSDRLTPQPR